MFRKSLLAGFAGLLLSTSATLADDNHNVNFTANGAETSSSANDHAPIGVMGDHMHNKGEFMLSYRYSRMDMDGNRIGTNSVSPETIATTIPNRFFGVAGQPPTLRVVPTEMRMDMHMFGAMYAPTDWLTLMAMGMWMDKGMDHITFQGGAGTTVLGTFSTESKGWGDTKLGGLFKLYDENGQKLHLNASLSVPTGSIKETDTVLAPNGMTPTLRLPYGMQLGTGTYDFHPGITYNGFQDQWSWGAQYSAEIRLENENDQGYSWGDKHSISAWGSYEWEQWISTSLRINAWTQDDIDGIDPNIVAPVQTADPDNYGGEVVEAAFGINLIGTSGTLTDHRLGFEISTPIYQDLNGPQMERDWAVTIGWQKAF